MPMGRWALAYVISVALSVPSLAGVSRLWGEAGERWEKGGRLPDFSKAGYKNGQTPPQVANVTNLNDFGGKGDGVTDNSEAFEKAIAATNNGALLIPEGRYLLRKRLTISKSNIVIRGMGSGKTVIYIDRSLREVIGGTHSLSNGFFQIQGAKEVGLEGFKIEFKTVAYAGHHNEPGWNGIYFTNAEDCWVNDITITDCDSGILNSHATRITYTNCVVSGRKGHYGYETKDGVDLLFHNNASLGDHHHSTGVERSHGIVYSDIRGGEFPIYMDNHGMNPYDNLFTNYQGTASYVSGGSSNRMPHAGKGTTFWNQKYKAGDEVPHPGISTWGGAKSPRDYLVIVTDLGNTQPSMNEKNWWEDVDQLEPKNLHFSQVARVRGLADLTGGFSAGALGSRSDFEEGNAANWAVMKENGGAANRYFLASTLYQPKSGGRLGEYAIAKSSTGGAIYAGARTPELDLAEGADLALILDFKDENNYLMALFSAKAGESGLYKVSGGSRQSLKTAAEAVIKDRTWHLYGFYREGGELRMAADGKVVAAAADAGNGGGRIGVGSMDDAVWFGRISTSSFPIESILDGSISVRRGPRVSLVRGVGDFYDALGRRIRGGVTPERAKFPLNIRFSR